MKAEKAGHLASVKKYMAKGKERMRPRAKKLCSEEKQMDLARDSKGIVDFCFPWTGFHGLGVGCIKNDQKS